ncbi:SURF1 family protein [Georgenia alba]|uniref:SURF1-like protein n=1 Tax=Georgenia alba TaxID=2233858 RepID=A0ABW2QAP1_9MICO
MTSTDTSRRQLDGTRLDYLRAAVTPRMIGLLVLLLAAALVCVRLGAWQLERASLRGEERAIDAHQAVLDRETAPVEDVLAPQTTFMAEHLGVPVEVTGAYRQDGEVRQVYVPGRTIAGQDAVLVVTALWVTDGPHAGAMMPVLRGWVPPSAVGLEDGGPGPAGPVDVEVAERLAVPDGEVTVTGWLKDSELARPADGPGNTVASISSGELAGLWGGPTWSGYVVEFDEAGTTADGRPDRSAASPTGLRHAPPPGMAEDTGFNLQNLAYAIEWVIFGGFALALWVRMLRDDVRHRREDAELAADG